MKQKTITLPNAVKLFPKTWSKIIDNVIPENFYQLSYFDKIKYEGRSKSVYYLKNDNNKLFFGKKVSNVKRTGKRLFLTYFWNGVIIIEGSKITTKNITSDDVKVFLSIIGLNFDFNVPNSYWVSKSIIGDILRKKIYSEESFYRCVLNKIYKLKGFNWKLFRDFEKCDRHMSIYDLYTFTKNLESSLRVLINLSNNNDWTKYNLLRDMLNCAVKLDHVVDFTWSDKRLSQEHLNQVRLLNLREISEKQTTPIQDYAINTDTIKMLNTEKDVYLEGLTMHHCLYTCYWNKIKSGTYLAFHMSFPENCTFSFKLKSNGTKSQVLALDQAYLAYDKRPSDITYKEIDNFIFKYHDKIKELLKNNKNINFNREFVQSDDSLLLPDNIIDLPFD